MIYNYIRLTDNLRQIDTKFSIKMSPILLKNANFPKFVQFQFLHFDAEHGKSIAVLDSSAREALLIIVLRSACCARGKERAFQSAG